MVDSCTMSQPCFVTLRRHVAEGLRVVHTVTTQALSCFFFLAGCSLCNMAILVAVLALALFFLFQIGDYLSVVFFAAPLFVLKVVHLYRQHAESVMSCFFS